MGLNKRNKKICFVNDFATGGGVERFIQQLSDYLSEKYRIYVISEDYDFDYKNYYNARVRYYYRYCEYKYKSKIIKRLLNKLNRMRVTFIMNRSDTVVFAKISVTYSYAKACKALKKIGWCHGDFNTNIFERQAFEERNISSESLKIFDYVVCISDTVRNSLIEFIGDSGNIIVRYNPIDEKSILEKSLQNIGSKKDGVIRFVAVGRLSAEKGFDLLVGAANKLAYEYNNFEVVILGEGPEYKKLLSMVEPTNNNRIIFLGNKDNPFCYMKSADWYVSSSISEGYSLTNHEAAIVGTPLLLTDIPCSRELVGDSEYGILMDPNCESIYNTLKTVLDKPELQITYRDKIRKRVQDINFSDRLTLIENILI